MLASTSNVLAQQGIGTNTPHRSAALQIDSQNKGILIPRMNLGYDATDNIITAPSITSPLNQSVKGLLVYNQTGIANVPEGFYYFDGTKWNPISKSYLQSNDHTTITGNGTSSDPYKVNIKPATDYTNQKVLATNTNGQVVWVEQGANTDTQTKLTQGTNVSITPNPSNFSVGGVNNYTIDVPTASISTFGVVKPGAGLSIAENGTLKVDFPTDNNTTYTAGNGITLTGTEFSVPVTTTGTGNVITNVEHTTDGITVTKALIATTDTKSSVVSSLTTTVAEPEEVGGIHQYKIEVKPLAGDVTGTINATRVEKIQGTPVSATPPSTGQVLVATSIEEGTAIGWVPTTISTTDTKTIVSGASGVEVTPTVNTQDASVTDYKVAVKYAMPQVFYMPAMLFNAQAGQTYSDVDLYAHYVDQFATPFKSSAGASGMIPHVAAATQLEYYITYADPSIIPNSITISADGKLTYSVGTGSQESFAYMTVVFVVKPNAVITVPTTP